MSLHLSSSSPSPAPSLPPCSFSCRVVSIDWYTTTPIKGLDPCYSDFRSSTVDKVPLVRVFGATPLGQKACLHVHGAFPYLYVPCTCADPNDDYLQLVARSIDHALRVSLGSASRNTHHVYKIILTRAKYVDRYKGLHYKIFSRYKGLKWKHFLGHSMVTMRKNAYS